jgi:glucose-1-phosphate thymidylyltransferase
MKGLIAAGGRATRLRPITHAINKHLLPLAGKPLIEYAVEKMAAAGITEIAININPGETEIPKALGDGSRFGVHLTYLEQTGGPQGVGHIVRNAESWINGDAFVFYLGDNVTLGPINHLVDRFQTEQLDCLLALAQVDHPNRFGVPEFVNGKIVRVLEKPENPPSAYAVTGIYVYGPAVFEAAKQIKPSARGEYEISDIHTVLIEEGFNVGHEEVTGWWMDTGRPEDLLKCNGLLLEQMPDDGISPEAVIEPGASINGRVHIGRGTHVSADSIINGPVWIGDDCHIFASQIGPRVSIGARCELKGVVITESLIMDDATLRLHPGKKLGGSMIGRFSKISSTPTEPASHLLLGDHGVVDL